MTTLLISRWCVHQTFHNFLFFLTGGLYKGLVLHGKCELPAKPNLYIYNQIKYANSLFCFVLFCKENKTLTHEGFFILSRILVSLKHKILFKYFVFLIFINT